MFRDEITLFENLSSKPTIISLFDWIQHCSTGWNHQQLINTYRQTGNQSIKRDLPMITVGAICDGGRKLDDVVKRTGWIAIDIDFKDNLHLPDAVHLRNEIAKIAFVAYAGLSVSGKGVWALIKVSNAEKQAEHFEQLKIDFSSLGIKLDPSKGKNPNDARFLSFDPDGIINSSFKIYNRVPKTKKRKRKITKMTNTTITTDIDYLVNEISKRQLNIAPDYETYRNIGFALADHFGESGRDFFHAIVCYSKKYNQRDADHQYSNCLRSKGRGITIGTLYYLCKKMGIDIKKSPVSSKIPLKFNKHEFIIEPDQYSYSTDEDPGRRDYHIDWGYC